MELQRGLGRGEKLRKLLDKKITPSGRTAPINFENAFNAIPVQLPMPSGRGAVFAALDKFDQASSQGPVGGRGKALITEAATKGATFSPNVDEVTSRMEKLTPSDIVPQTEEPVPIHPVTQKRSSDNEAYFTTNHVRLMIQQNKGVFQYAVTFDPRVDSKSDRVDLLSECTQIIGDVFIFDGEILYLPFKLDKKTITLNRCIQYNFIIKIIIKYVCKHSFSDQIVIDLYNKLFKRIMNLLGMVEHGPNIYNPNLSMYSPFHRLEIWPGYVTAIDEFEGGLMICCEATHCIIQNKTVLELLQSLKNSENNRWKDAFRNQVLGKSVLTRFNNKLYKVDVVAFDKSPMNSFKRRNGDIMTYKTYYDQEYKLSIRDERQPLLMSKDNNNIEGQADKWIVVIPELCYLTWINDERLENIKDSSKYIQISPQQRMNTINKYIKNIKDSPEATKILADWGISLNDTYMELPRRILPPVNIIFGNGNYLEQNGMAKWLYASYRHKVFTSIEIHKWSVIYPKKDEQSVVLFIKKMRNLSSSIGLRILRPKYFTWDDNRICSFQETLRSISKSDDQIVLVVLPFARNINHYKSIIKVCFLEDPPIQSQVISSDAIKKKGESREFALKIARKMNCKLGGTSWSVHFPLQNTMVCGLDTYYDRKGRKNSVGALVSSLNQNLTKWHSKVFFQPPGYEFGDGLAQAMLNTLDVWYKNNKMYPEQVVIYCNGLSDDQIKQCREREIPQIMNAFKNVNPGYNPKILFVVTQKKINTKYFLTQGNKYDNPPPGSILDHSVTRHPCDFFLVSHHVLEGTVCPTYYIVVQNTTNMSPDEVQRLSFTLTHLYYNYSGTISVPAPCQYAHKLALLVGEVIENEPSQLLSDTLFYL